MKDHALFQGDIITKQRKYNEEIKTLTISTQFGTKHAVVMGIQVSSNEGPRPIPRGDNYRIVKIHEGNLK